MQFSHDLGGARFSVLRCAQVNLLVEQASIKGVAPALDALPGSHGEVAATVRHAGRDWPLYFLDAGFRPQARPSDEFRLCVCLQGESHASAFALGCESFELVDTQQGECQPLPGCMMTASLPFDASRRIGEQAALHVDLERMFRYLQSVAAETV